MVRKRGGEEVEVKFRRDLGLREIVMIGLGPTLGTTVFLLIGPGIGIAGPSLLLVLVLNFGVTILTAMAYMELGSAFPETGGGYMWVKEAFGGPVGFLGGWLSWFGHCIVCAFYVASFGISIAIFAGPGILPYEREFVRVASIALLLVFLYVNYRGTKTTGRSSTYVTVVLAGLILTFVVAGLAWFALNPSGVANFRPFFRGEGLGTVVSILTAMGLTFVVFEGYEIIAQTGEEVSEPEKNVPRANWIVLTIATAIFVLVGFVTIAGLAPSEECLDEVEAVACASARFFGQYPFVGLTLIVAGIILGSLAALNSLIYSSSRVAFAMGRDGSLPKLMGRLHPKHRTPHIAILASGLVIGLMIATLDPIEIAVAADLMFLILFTMVNAAAIVLRRTRPDVRRYYVTPLFPLVPIVGLGTKAVLAVSLYLISPTAIVIAFVWVVLGFGIYYLWAKRERIAEVAGPVLEAIIPLPEEKYHILVPVENLADRTLVEFAAIVGRVEDAEVTLMHVVEVPATLPIDAIDRLYILEVRREMGDLRKIVSDARVGVSARVVVSHEVAEAVLETIEKEDVDLLIVGWKGGWRRGLVLGTNIDRFVQEAPCDVVVFRTAGLKEKLDRILVMNAPEWHVSYATGYAILLAKQHRAAITIFSPAQTDAELNQAKAYSNRLAMTCKTHGVPVEETFVKVRSTVDAVVAEAKGYDLLVLGASSEWRLTQFAFGAMQDQIARQVDGPVMMVRKVRKKVQESKVSGAPPSAPPRA
jgi:amino acid transporter/nucleotide-binding universal stress UspA family protein